MSQTNTVKVWDPIVRIGHWSLVIAFFTAYFTEEEFMTQHVWAGYVVTGIVTFRILWGLIGSKHARFSDFIYRPSRIFGYLKGLAQRKPQHYLGHNPAGGAMVIALLVSLIGTVYTGMALYAVENNAGPLAGMYGAQASAEQSLPITLIANASAKEGARENARENESDEANENEANETMGKNGLGGTGESSEAKVLTGESEHESASENESAENEQGEEFWEGLHEFFTNLTLLLVALHVAGVIISSLVDRENLIKAMISGRKTITKE